MPARLVVLLYVVRLTWSPPTTKNDSTECPSCYVLYQCVL